MANTHAAHLFMSTFSLQEVNLDLPSSCCTQQGSLSPSHVGADPITPIQIRINQLITSTCKPNTRDNTMTSTQSSDTRLSLLQSLTFLFPPGTAQRPLGGAGGRSEPGRATGEPFLLYCCSSVRSKYPRDETTTSFFREPLCLIKHSAIPFRDMLTRDSTVPGLLTSLSRYHQADAGYLQVPNEADHGEMCFGC